MSLQSNLEVNIDPTNTLIKLKTEMKNISFNDILSAAYYMMTGKEFDFNMVNKFNLFEF